MNPPQLVYRTRAQTARLLSVLFEPVSFLVRKNGMKPKVLLDVDGILTDFHATVANIATRAGFPITADQMTEWDMSISLNAAGAPNNIVSACLLAMASEGFNKELEPSLEAVKNLPKLELVADVVFVTAPNVGCATWTDERIFWMKNFFDVNPSRILFANEKQHIMGDVFVDDNPANTSVWAKHNPSGLSILWDAPYNRNAEIKHRVKSWKELVELIGKNYAQP